MQYSHMGEGSLQPQTGSLRCTQIWRKIKSWIILLDFSVWILYLYLDRESEIS